MKAEERIALINQMGFTIGFYSVAANAGEWSVARNYLNRLIAGIGLLAMEIDENDPLEREN